VPDPRHPGKMCPATGQFAIREARTCARNILATIDGRRLKKFDGGQTELGIEIISHHSLLISPVRNASQMMPSTSTKRSLDSGQLLPNQ